MRVLVTGANGFVGKNLCSVLTKLGYDIFLVSKAFDRYLAEKSGKLIVCNLLDINDDIKCALQEVDVVIHLAGRAHIINETSQDPYRAYSDVNVNATKNLASLASKSGVKRFIFLSSIKVNGEQTTDYSYNEEILPNPEDDYGRSKLEAELNLMQIAEATQMQVVIIRPPLIYGKGVKANFKNLLKLCELKLPLPFATVNNKRSLIYIENLINFIILCIAHPKAANQTFMVSDDDDVSTTRLVRTIRKSQAIPSLLLPIPQSWLVFFLTLIGKSQLAKRLCGNLQLDISKAKNILDWKPPYTFEQGIQKTIDEYQQHD